MAPRTYSGCATDTFGVNWGSMSHKMDVELLKTWRLKLWRWKWLVSPQEIKDVLKSSSPKKMALANLLDRSVQGALVRSRFQDIT